MREINLNAAVREMWKLILKDMDEGLVPRTVTSFADLHDHVDANEYLIEAFPHLEDLDTYGDEELRLFNLASTRIDLMLRAGKARCDNPRGHNLNGCGCRKSS